MPPSEPVSPTAVMVGLLQTVEEKAIVLGGRRIVLLPGVMVPDVPLGTSITVLAKTVDGVMYAEKIERSHTPMGSS